MDDKKVNRINELARKSRTEEGLTPAEKEEQAALRAEYVAAIRNNLRATLDNTYVIDANGNKQPVKKANDQKRHKYEH